MTKSINCYISVLTALRMLVKAEKARSGFYTFMYRYSLAAGVQFKHRVDPETSVVHILKLGARDYRRIAKERGLIDHELGELVFEGIQMDHDAKTVTFAVRA